MMVSRIWARSGVYLRPSDLRALRKMAQRGSMNSGWGDEESVGLMGSSDMFDCMQSTIGGV